MSSMIKTVEEKHQDEMVFISDILKKNFKGQNVYSHIYQTGGKTRNGKYDWYRMVVFDSNNNEIGSFKGIKMNSNKTGNDYYKFINNNLLNHVKKQPDEHIQTVSELYDQITKEINNIPPMQQLTRQ